MYICLYIHTHRICLCIYTLVRWLVILVKPILEIPMKSRVKTQITKRKRKTPGSKHQDSPSPTLWSMKHVTLQTRSQQTLVTNSIFYVICCLKRLQPIHSRTFEWINTSACLRIESRLICDVGIPFQQQMEDVGKNNRSRWVEVFTGHVLKVKTFTGSTDPRQSGHHRTTLWLSGRPWQYLDILDLYILWRIQGSGALSFWSNRDISDWENR